MNLENIADMLLKKEITPKEAEILVKKKDIFGKEEYFFVEDGFLKVIDKNEKTLSYINYSEILDKEENKIIVINNVESFKKQKGYFKKAYNFLENLARKKRVSDIYFGICKNNFLTKRILEKKVFSLKIILIWEIVLKLY